MICIWHLNSSSQCISACALRRLRPQKSARAQHCSACLQSNTWALFTCSKASESRGSEPRLLQAPAWARPAPMDCTPTGPPSAATTSRTASCPSNSLATLWVCPDLVISVRFSVNANSPVQLHPARRLLCADLYALSVFSVRRASPSCHVLMSPIATATQQPASALPQASSPNMQSLNSPQLHG